MADPNSRRTHTPQRVSLTPASLPWQARLAMGEGDIEAGRKKLDERMLSRSPMKRWADADEIAQTIAFLASEQSGLITGATIPVDGGLHLT